MDTDDLERLHVETYFDGVNGDYYTLLAAMQDCLKDVAIKESHEHEYCEYLVREQQGGRRGNLMLKYYAEECQLVVKQIILYPRGQGDYLLDNAAIRMLDDETLQPYLNSVVMECISSKPLIAKMQERGWTPLYAGTCSTLVKRRE